MRTDKRLSQKADKKAASRVHKRGIVGYSKKTALLEEAITHMNTGKYGRSSAALKELLALDPQNTEARRLFATLHLRLGSLVTARQAFESLANEAIGRQDYWLAESLLREYLAAGPRCVPFLEQLAYVYQEKGDEMAAVAELGKAIEILRDDSDAENPQKAAQLYSKIRELAPASSVALQLAPLFDVQTGEFLVRPHDPSTLTTTPHDHATSIDSMTPDASLSSDRIDQPVSDVMPWELLDEPDSAPDAEVMPEPLAAGESEAAYEQDAIAQPDAIGESEIEVPTPTFTVEAAELPPPTPPEDLQPPYSFKIAEDTPLASFSTTSESEPATSGIPSPMPWEQMADASVQIVEPEIPPPPDATCALESVPTSLPTAVVPPDAIEEPPGPVPTYCEPPTYSEPSTYTESSACTEQCEVPTLSSEPVPAASAVLSAPMPWEQVSDPAIQIPISDSPPSHSSEEPVPSMPSAHEIHTVASPNLLDVAPSALQSSTPVETPASTSFSWNSVFDKAWKFTADTMAPSPSPPLEESTKVCDEPKEADAPIANEVISSDTPTEVASSPLEEPAVAVPLMPVSDMTLVDQEEPQNAALTLSVDPPQASPPEPPPQETPSHWNTGEVAVQVHRPSKKKKRWEKDQNGAAESAAGSPAVSESQSETAQEAIRAWKSTSAEPVPPLEPTAIPTVDTRPAWMQASETITFNREEPSPPQPRWSDVATAVPSGAELASTAAASAVDVLFSPSLPVEELQPHVPASWSTPRPRFMARLHRVRIGISSLIGSCFSTTRSLSFLALMVATATVVVGAGAICALGVLWMVMEDQPSPVYQALSISPPRVITDATKNGYLLLLGFEAPVGQDPVQAGYERRPERASDQAAARVCTGDEAKAPGGTGGAYDHVVKSWIRNGDPLALMRGQGALKSLTSRESTALARYQQWLTMPFDDWGFGQLFSPNCTHVLFTHRLFLLEGFSQDLSAGIDRLEMDMQAWRSTLAQSKTLAMKMLALTAVQDDVSVASGLLTRVDLDGAALARLSKMVRPLDQVELSIRWPMQSQFVWATNAVRSEIKEDKAEDRPWYASIAAAMRLPIQRRANAYAEYYEAANKAVAGGRYTNLPKLSTYVRTPASGLIDYVANPVEHLVGIEPLPSWEPHVMRMIETDAQLRLAGLQAWLRRGPQDSDVLMRLAKAGQAYYDPFTGLPMLVNQRKGVIYSVGRDGKDQEGDDLRDVIVMIPLSVFDSRRPAVSTASR